MCARFKVMGTNSDHDTCNHCGRTGLKRVVWLQAVDSDGNDIGDVEPIGTSCAATLMRRTTTQVTRLAEQADRDAAEAERRKVHEIGDERSVCNWAVEAIGNNGGTITPLCFANGKRSLIRPWAEHKFPGRMIDVRKAV